MSEQKVVVQPLQGKRILVTRTREQAGTLSTRLQALGAVPIEFPTIRIVPPSDWTQFDGALHRFYGSGSPAEQGHAYDWLIFTSVNGVHIWLDRAQALGYDSSALAGVRVATIGPATAAALAHGYTVPVAADDERGREVLHLLRERQLDVLTFTSSSTVRNFVSWFKSSSHMALDASSETQGFSDILAPLSALTIASIGPITSQTARELGLHVTIQAAEFTIDGLVSAIVQHEV